MTQRSKRCAPIAASVSKTPPATARLGTRPRVRRPSSAWFDWLERIEPLLWCENAEPVLWWENAASADIDDPIDAAEANENTLPTDPIDAALPMERIESCEQIDRTEFSERHDHRFAMTRSVALVQTARPLTRSGLTTIGFSPTYLRWSQVASAASIRLTVM
jgi:hypothetical protein